ncbi:hypothetical protein [Tsukamurella pseudospumae]|uniref:Uncharacterized protein n=1 Tax=Tsukamurella pseudospumae TaxID=239498 RepID=A0A138A8B1_9ACTN|nr:hypothetical protein [Tsukamurella pseudospumae]KXO91221.1 hypothetical protein AXK61_06585 [Tsukamurella pseudospumae]KXP06672.1 hypothetical protein AXK60_11410 [Tsukamurella pseudospumae]
MRDPSTSLAFLRVERDMNVSGIRYEFLPASTDPLPQWARLDRSSWDGLWLRLADAHVVGIAFDHVGDEEERTHRVADQVQVAVLDSAQVIRPARTWPRATRGGSPLWALMRDGIAVWESVDGTERYRIGELPEGR